MGAESRGADRAAGVKNPPQKDKKIHHMQDHSKFSKLLSATAYNIVDSYRKITSYGPQNNFLISKSL